MKNKCCLCHKSDDDDNMPRYIITDEFDEDWMDRFHPWCVSDFQEFQTHQSIKSFLIHPDDKKNEEKLWQLTEGVSPNSGHMWLTSKMKK